jgi:glutamate 5-kinase
VPLLAPQDDEIAQRHGEVRRAAEPRAVIAAKRVVVKIGSALLVESASGEIRRGWLKTLCADVAALKRDGKDVILVSSGAIALGRRALGLKPGALKLEESQAAAAVGQVLLAHAYADIFADEHIVAAQVLLTLGDTEERARYLNARATLKTLLSLGSVPVINENDTVATAEIRFGDNDRLAARVASMMEADCLVLLSDVDGLYTADPTATLDAKHIADVPAITRQIEAMAGTSVSGIGRGGMLSKLIAAKIAAGAGCETIIAKGAVEHPIQAIEAGAKSTRFHASTTPAQARKRWIAGVLKPQGVLIVDAGAADALAEGKSLLPIGIRQIDGRFERGDAVAVRDQQGNEIARGLCAYNASDAERIAGKKSNEIEAILGYRGRDEMIHRDDLALTDVP